MLTIEDSMSLTLKTVGQVGQVGHALSMRVSAVPPTKKHGGTRWDTLENWRRPEDLSHRVPPQFLKVGQKESPWLRAVPPVPPVPPKKAIKQNERPRRYNL